ncbi:MAG TPA: twin-arginine translocase TatA/TatE family subunit [Methylococcaceae bacterium]|nr:twin-arginine translocase TatA/TatE family subunit [Methylococcaceae bacterium]
MGVSVTQLTILLAIVILLFGTRRLRSIGSDLGSAISSFRNAVREDESEKTLSSPNAKAYKNEATVAEQNLI